MSADQKVILGIFVIYLALNAIIGIVFSKRQGSKQHVSSEKKFFIGGRNTVYRRSDFDFFYYRA